MQSYKVLVTYLHFFCRKFISDDTSATGSFMLLPVLKVTSSVGVFLFLFLTLKYVFLNVFTGCNVLLFIVCKLF